MDVVSRVIEADFSTVCGIFSLERNISRLNIAAICEFHNDGLRKTVRRTFNIRVIPQKKLSKADFRRILFGLDRNEHLRSAVATVSEDNDWYSIYRIIEDLEAAYGDSEKKLQIAGKHVGVDVKTIKRNCNQFRHRANKYIPPPKMISLGEAKAQVRKLIHRALTEARVSKL